MSDYPEHDKIRALEGDNQVVGDFIEWLCTQGYRICEPIDDEARGTYSFAPLSMSTEKTIAKYFDIDLEKIETENRALLDKIRSAK